MFAFQDKVIHVDPYGKLTDYAKLPKADLILITHEHADHLDAATVKLLRKPDTPMILTKAAAERLPGGTVLANGDTRTVLGVKIEAVPAYNLVHKRDDGQPFHPKGVGNGYVLTFGDQRVYVAGDTENIPEMKQLGKLAVAFIPVNLPYTMTPEMAAAAAKMLQAAILYPYHYGETDTAKLLAALKDLPGTEVRLRPMK
jgi:L-ascorbate metabolism protein UlaG (beta-lactamase superfamily)